LGLNPGALAIARISPVAGSTATIDPPMAS
jgi:hypothetical protein